MRPASAYNKRDMHAFRHVLSAMRRADSDFSLIDEGDKIAVGVSGGKDSLCLLKALSLYGRYSGKSFEIVPIFLDLGFDWDRNELGKLKDFAISLGLNLVVSDSAFVYDVLKTHAKEGKHLPCSICSRMKKAAINRLAKEKGCGKVAFAHHNEDALETLIMNMIHGGRVATFEPKMRLERAKVTFIRPLIYCHEKTLCEMAMEESLPILDTHCPANKHTEREKAKNMLKSLYEAYPESEGNLMKMLANHSSFMLYFGALEYESEENPAYAYRPAIFADDLRLSKAASHKRKEGEETFRILFHHQIVGEFSVIERSGHRFLIHGVDGPLEARVYAIGEWIKRVSRRISPCFLSIKGDQKTAKALGFVKKENGRSAVYEKKCVL